MTVSCVSMVDQRPARQVCRVLMAVCLALIPNALLFVALSRLNALSQTAVSQSPPRKQALRLISPEKPEFKRETPVAIKDPLLPEEIITVDLDAPHPHPAKIQPMLLDLTPASSFTVPICPGPTSDGIPFAEDVDEMPGEVAIRRPSYPVSARRLGQEGTVIVRLLISETGRVEDVKVVQCDGGDAFRRAVLAVATTWRFRPAREDGKPIRVWGIKRVRFKLENG